MGMMDGFFQEMGLSEGYVSEAELAEEMDRLEEMPAADMKSDDIMECYVEAVIANERNYNKIMMSVAHEEMSYFMEHGSEMVYEGARLDAFFDKVKAMIDKAWQKIKSIFEKAVGQVNAWISSDKRFVDKYSDKILAASGRICEIDNTFDIDMTKVKTNYYSELSNNLKKRITVFDKGSYSVDDSSKTKEYFERELFSGDMSKEEYIKDIKDKLGLSEKKSTTINGAQVIEELKTGKATKSNIKIQYNDAKKSVAEMKKSIDDAKREASKTKSVDDKNSSYGVISSACNKVLSAMHNIQSLQLQALKVYHSNCRKIASRVVAGKTYKESASMGSSFGDFLD